MRKITKAIAAIMLMTTVLFITIGCNKENNDSDVKVTTYTPQEITQNTAKCGGDVIVTQGLTLNELGVCWSTSSRPTVEDSHLSTSNWSEPYVCTITRLEPGTKYHVRAYALRGLEYYYGDDKSFTTEGNSGGGGGNGGSGNGTYNGHAYVDLGLPGGTLWATCNVGANAPEDYGNYFAWAETQPKDYYDWSTYQHCNGSENTLTKYFTDNLTTLLPEDDAATANWGNGWRMPTKKEVQELYNNTTVTWTTEGQLFTASNGNSLFLPAAGYRNGSSLYYAGSRGFYWSSSLVTFYPGFAWDFGFISDGYRMTGSSRCGGYTVRPVRSARQN